MSRELSDQLSAWLAATDIQALTLRGPGVHLCLRQVDGRVLAVAPHQVLRSAPAAVMVGAPSVGVFLPSHPVQGAPLAAVGQVVAQGQVLGLLQIGALLLPVPAAQAGIVAAVRAEAGATVGYGTPLFELIPIAAP